MTEPTVGPEISMATVAGLLRARALERPEQVAFLFLGDGEAESARLTYAELDRRASAVAATLAETVAPGERALLLYPPGLDFIVAFFGCLYAGVVAVPAYPPRPNDRSQSRLRSIAQDATPRAALTTSALRNAALEARGLFDVAPELAGLRWIATDGPEGGARYGGPDPDPESIAFLQYTSGSTATPKGVMVTHANLLHNERMIGAAFRMDETSVVVGWLPLYHDMGLIGNVLQPIHAGGSCVLMSPVSFLQRPMRWLEAISRYRGTTSGGPNFAYELCLRKATPEALAALDLSSWRVAFNGAEPVRASTLESFAEVFAPAGFRPEAFYPCYGLAEATLFVTGGFAGTLPGVMAREGGRPLVSCGVSWMGQRVAIADPETGVERAAGEEGEVWIAGPSVARGYWNNLEATERDFNAFLPSGEGPFLRTGDLGVLSGGELYVTGRLKDLIILRGRNLYPQDIELTAERAHPDLRAGGGAAFSVEVEGEERLVVVHEVERRLRHGIEEVAEAVRRAVAAEHEVQVHEVVLIRQAGLPKTSSGKVQRRLCRNLYLNDELPVVGRSALARGGPAAGDSLALSAGALAALEPAERRPLLAAWLRERAAAVLGVPASAVSMRQPLTALGLDSLTAIELKGSVETALEVPLPLAELLQGAGIDELADLLIDGLAAGPAPDAPPLRALALEGDQPLSSGQRGLWFLHRLDPEGGAYNIAVTARTRGLDADAFIRALNALAARHEALRTVFPEIDGEPAQRVLAALAPDVAVEDLPGTEEELQGRLGEAAWRPFDLAAGPLVRARVFQAAGGEAVVLLAVHHIVADFASLAVMARDLSAFYARETGASGPVPEPLGLRYADFAHWQAATLAGPRGGRLADYWLRRLEGVRDLDLPSDRSRPPVQTSRGGARAASLPPALLDRARHLGGRQGATLFMTLLAAFQAQLARYSGQEDFAVGAPVAGRVLPELSGLVGYFVNLLPLRADLAGEPSFARVLERTRRTALEGMENGDFPFPRLAERLRPVRDPARSPVFQTLLVFQGRRPQDPAGLAAFSLGEAGARLELAGLPLESVRLEERRAQFDLTLRAAEDGRGGLGLSLEYNADLFEGGSAERMLGHFRTLLESAVANPEASVWSLPLLAPAERRQVLEDWNATACDYPTGLLLHQLFEAQAERTPDADALVAADLRLTYDGMNRRANQLAHHLRRLGVGPEDRVGVCLRRSGRMMVSLYAVLKAGGAYVPLDPTYPRERLASILEDSGARVVIGEDATASRLAEESGARWLSLDEAAGRIAAEPAENPQPVTGPGNLSYLIYTSGSTGRPKAVMIEHRSPVVLMHWAREHFSPEELAGTLGSTSIGFDVSVFEIFAPLAWGGRLFVTENLLALPGMLGAEEVRLVCGAPSVVAELVRAGSFPSWVRTVNLGGEAVPPALVEELAVAAPGVRILDVYGPSEDTTYSTFALLEPGRSVVIGEPVANSRVHLLDARGELVPAGVPGELFLAGAGLARGYLDRPDLTAERFLPDPFAPAPGERLYRTGDLARRRADGVLEYLGRIDHQVKVRGFRVELGEIEAALARLPGVREAVVVARQDGDRGSRLVAYVTPAGLSAAQLRSGLREVLPEYMVPTAFVALEAFPLSTNGKVDRKALPDPGAPSVTAAPAAFQRPVDEVLAGLVAGVLGVESVGPRDDFFALGGHSLLATRLLARVSRVFGVDLPVSSVFLHPTVAGLAGRIAEETRGAAAPPVRPAPRKPGAGLPLSFAQRRLWFLDRLEPGTAVYNMPGLLRISGPLDAGALEAALTEVARRHEALRTVFRIEDGEPVQAPEAPIPGLPWIDLQALPEERAAAEAERLARVAAVHPFNLEKGPLWRAFRAQTGPEESQLVITLHHAVADGWSLVVMLAELAALYAGEPLPELPVQYADWAVWQREWLRGEVLEAQVEWWRERLAGAPVLELPADRPRPLHRSGRGGVRAASLPEDVSMGLERLARGQGATPFMVLLAAFQAQLARITGVPSVTVGSPVANRGQAEVEGLIGFFVNMLALRTPVEGDPAFGELLARVREVCLGAYAHQDVPFERLVEELRPERQRGRNPLFQVVFQLEEPLAVERLGAATAEVRRLATGTAKFDLTLSVVSERGGYAATLEYDADLFDPATADRLLGHWRTLAAGVAAAPAARLSELPLMTAAEAAQVRAWQGQATDYPREVTIHGLFLEAVRRSPDAVALEMGDERVSYAELSVAAERLAARLRGLGVGLETRVGLCAGRSVALVAGMLGILKAGGVYVPLDPAYPAERLALLAEDAGLALAMVAEGADAPLPAGLPLLRMREDGSPAGPGPDLFAPAAASFPESAAYVMYTSGSTGRPKGVEVPHRAVVRLVRGTGFARFGPEEVFLHLAPPSFDAATLEVWGALLNGARLAIFPGRPSADELAAAIAHHGVTTLWLTAGLFHSLVDSRPEALRGVTQLLAGGDALSAPHVRRALAALPDCTLINGYGPTENTTFTTTHAMRSPAEVGETVPIGRPIANTTVRLLDADLQPVPAGIPGELYAGGDGLARGYVGRPDLTAERFVPDPAGEPGARLYRTGDLARWRPDGALEFLGRVDQQVKIRGFRVEPGEVEAALLRHPGVAGAAVVARGEPGGKSLVAWVVPAEGTDLPEGLRDFLRAALPEPMVPARLIPLESLPLTANGKVDRRALARGPLPDEAGAAGHVAPRTALEERLAAIWSEVLGIERVGIHDDFFELGGHSLLAVRVLARIQDVFGVSLPVGELFEEPTVAGLAARLTLGREKAPEPVWTSPEPARPAPRPAGAGVAPRNPVEERLAAIWSEVLGVERVGIHDDFFDLGGHSLLAHRVVMRVAQEMEVDLDLQALFETPTVAELAARVAGSGAAPVQDEAPVPEGDAFPLSFAQQRLWLLDLIEPDSAKYNVPVALRLEGDLDVPRLLAALAEIVRRHEPLRTVYARQDGEPRQVVLPPPGEEDLDFTLLDLREMSPQAREEELRAALRAEAGRPFDLARGPVVRFLLLRLADREHAFMASFHHIATDGWSMSVFFREMSVIYGDLAAGQAPSLPPLPLRYADWAVWQRRALEGGALEPQLAYWRRQLAGVPVLELPADRPRTLETGDRGDLRRVEIPADVVARFRRSGRVTPFTVLLSGYVALLSRLSGQDDLSVGTTAAGRDRLHTEDLIGFFVNTLVIRAEMGDAPGFDGLLRRVRDTALTAQANQDVPLEKVIEELQPERSTGISPLFQVMFTYLASPLAAVPMPGLEASLIDVELEIAKYDLILSAYELEGRLTGWMEYRTGLFDAATVDRWAGHLRTLLESAAAEPSRPLPELPILNEDERRQLLEQAAGPAGIVADAGLLHTAFERRAAESPDAVAVETTAGESLTYGELNARAGRLARRLAALGAGPERPVGVRLHRSLDGLTALLAVLKAGAAYLPLDPSYPQERVEAILADARPAAVLDGLDAGTAEVDHAPADPASLAYVIFTSGSTGRPKGVEVEHGPAARHMREVARIYGLAPGDRVLQMFSPGFDLSLELTFAALSAGATLVLAGAEPWGSGDVTARLERLGITVAELPPPLWQRWVRDSTDLPAAPPRLRLLVSGGDEMLADAARLWGRTALAGIPLLNGYGPTEAVVTATFHEVDPEREPAWRAVALGRPLPERRAYVLDSRYGLQPHGIVGELALGGLLARGYRGRPALTAEAFVPDPFSGVPGARLYRTGDLARMRPDGELMFAGRRDGQVKVRGFRIETGEVESVLRTHPDVRDAVVLAPEIGGERRLAAWIVPAPGTAVQPAALQAFLRERLPAYMVPAYVTAIEAVPVTPNGKLDRRALPAPEATGGEGRSLVPLEELLAGIWSELLGVERVGAGDSFFGLGGHSLIATQLVSRLRSALGVELPVSAVFEAPVLEDMAHRVADLLGEPAAPAAPPIVPAPRAPEGDPLSFAQKRLWFLHRLDPESSAYNVPGALRLLGDLNPEALAAALSEIVRRHEALRTVFRPGPEEPVQVVLPAAGVEMPLIDLRALPEAARAAAAREILAAEARRPFDLAAGPLLRPRLLRLADGEHLLSVAMHHIVSDAWSLRVTFRELSALYRAALAGEISPLPELAVQYADFARWQRSWLSGEVLARELDHWRRTLAGAPESLELPLDRPRPAEVPAAGHLPFAVPAGLAADLTALAHHEGWTLFMALLAVFESLLARWSGQRDLVVGAPIANRNHLEIEGLIGFFTNTLALRVELPGDPAFREIAGRARAATLEAHAHQELPFERLVEELAPQRGMAGTPLFQVMLVLQHDPAAGLALPGLGAEMVDVPLEEAKFDLTLFFFESDGGLTGHLEYNRGLFDPATAERLLGHLQTLMAGAVAAPGARLSELPLLTAAERAQLADWSRAPRMPQPPARIHERVARQAALRPEAEAVVWGDASLTYGELLSRARRVAVRLRELGVGPDVPVGIFVERSLDLPVAILAALEAGGAYLPLDPGYPRERLRLMLGDAHVPVVLTQPSLLGHLPEGPHRALLISEALAAVPEPPAGPLAAVDADNLVYLVYTSGSTGRPKGVAMTHGAISAMLDWQLRTSRAGSGRTLQFSALSFDVSFQEIFSAWCTGGSVVLVSEDARRDPPALLRLLAEQRVERLFLPFVALQQLAVAARPEELPGSLREVMSAGEQLYVTPQVAALFAALPGSALYNHYGPSETHAATWLPLEGDPGGWPERPTVGRPVDHARVFLLDHDLQQVPVGVVGEIYVGGAGLARGYLAHPDLTAERFLPDPFDEVMGWEAGSRLYRTGDMARRLPSGEIEYLGRRDHQVKIRGQRIELAEVEATLAGHPAMRQVAVAVRGTGSGSRRLVAYVVFREEAEPPAFTELRAFLAERLPDAMIPTAWVRLEALPLTPSGKVDRRALPAPEEKGEAVAVAPRDPVEEMLAEIWREVLGVQRVGVHDDFFELGGHSLLATQVMSRLREAFSVELPLRRLFEGPTVADLAHAVELALAAGSLPAEPVTREERPAAGAPLSFAQERLWFLEHLQPGSTVYSLPLFLHLTGELDAPVLAAAFGEIVRRHEALRTVFAERDGAPAQVVLPAAPVPLPRVDLSALPAAPREREADRLTAAEAARPFDLARGPLMRLTLLRLAQDEHRLLLDMHHLISDGWSLGVLVRELEALYTAFRQGRPSPLPELPVQYADFSIWQRRWLAGEALERQMGYWRERLRGLPGGFELPSDRPRPAERSQRGAEHRFRVERGLAAGLVALARRESATPFMVLAASMMALLSRLSGQGDLAIGTPVANRNRLETEQLIGFFVNTLVLRGRPADAPGFLALLRQVRETTLGAYSHQDLPFEKLVDELHPERDPSRTPLYQVMFALQNAPLPAAALPGLALRPEEPPGRSAKFDLAVVLVQDAEGMAGVLEYSTDLFDCSSMARFAGHWLELLAGAVHHPESALATLPLLSAAQRQQTLLEWNDRETVWGDDACLHELFERQADLRPEAIAAVWHDEVLTYGELEEKANRIAGLLREAGVVPGTPVALWMERSLDMIAAVLGVVKAGGHYLPLDLSWPVERAETVLAASRTPVLLTRSAYLPRVLDAWWRLPLADVICLDVETPRPPAEAVDPAAVRSLWDFVAERAVDRVSAGGFVSSYTGQAFAEAEVDEYRDHVLGLAAPWLRPDARVLEVGNGSGLLFWEMAPRVARAVGIDPSPLTQERNRETAAARGLANVELVTGFAHEIDGIEGEFDFILIASTVQFFPGPLYLESFVEKALARLAPGGALLIADVPDARRQDEFHRSLVAAGVTAKPAEIRWYNEDLFRDLATLPGAGEVAVLPRREGFANELGFRYDVLVTRGEMAAAARRKRLWTGWHVAQQPAERPRGLVLPDHFAYVIHTSGSTGAPKGIGVQHRPAAGLIHWLNGAYGMGPGDRLLFVTSLGFDLSVYDIFGTLAGGATIHVAAEEVLRDPLRLAALLREEPVTLWDSAPAALQQLAPLFPAPGEGDFPLRLVMLSGDWIPVRLPDQVRAAFPRARVIAMGGATEATVWSNVYPVGHVDPAWPSIPYGRPIPNAAYYVLDRELAPSPIGVPGDLYIGGDVLSVGYVYQPELTAAAFVPDPFVDRPGARMYRTGDRARFFTDGVLEFLGRVDHQVKIRGYRIELGEIEVALNRHPGVREAVVLAREDVPGDKRLVGYIVPSRQPAPAAGELRSFLLETLPEYMVPWAFVELASFPVTTNGKLDRGALPAPQAAAGGGGGYVAPRNELEKAIAAVWREVLEVDRVGVHDNFFESGGSSLLIVKLHGRLVEALGRDIPVMELFRHTTIDSLARKLAEETGEAAALVEEAKAETVRERARSRQDSLRQLRQARTGRRGKAE